MALSFIIQSLSHVLLFATAMDCSKPDFPILHHLLELAHSCPLSQWCHPINYLVLCCPLLLLPSIFPSIRVFSNELCLHYRWPKYWNFSINPSNEYSGLTSFRIDWFDLLESKGFSGVFFKSINSLVLNLLYGSAITSTRLLENHSSDYKDLC